MPGPRNAKKKRKSQLKSQQKKKNSPPVSSSIPSIPSSFCSSRSTSSPSPPPLTPPPISVLSQTTKDLESYTLASHSDSVYDDIRACRAQIEQIMLKPPFIHDPGNGPRVRDARAFLDSEFFAQRPALDDPLCAEFAQEEVLQMLLTVLPEEAAIILWYNKSRLTSRVCPVCQRLYRLGDVLPDHMPESDSEAESDSDYYPRAERRKASPQLEREQELSGICSPICFILASFSHSNAIKSAWGRTADEMDDETWDLLNAPRSDMQMGQVSNALSMLVKMTRLHDLGLAQLCLGEDVEELEDEA